jgi:hypothetical protein
MSAVPRLDPSPASKHDMLAQLRSELSRRFPGAVAPPAQHPSELLEAPFAWVEVALGQGGIAWLAAWTRLLLARDPLGRPALWVDTHGTYTAGDLLDLEGRLVVVRPSDPHEAHVAADIAIRSGSFAFVALEMHRALHPTPLGRLARLAGARHGEGRTPIAVWGEAPPFVAPPSGVPRTPLIHAVEALFSAFADEPDHVEPPPRDVYPRSEPDTAPYVLRERLTRDERHERNEPDQHERSAPTRAPHATDRLRPLDRAADRRPPPSGAAAGASGARVDAAAAPLLAFPERS